MAFNYSFRVAVSLAVALLAGVMWTVDVFWGALCTALLPIALYWQQKLYRHHVRKVLFMLDAIENNDNAIHLSLIHILILEASVKTLFICHAGEKQNTHRQSQSQRNDLDDIRTTSPQQSLNYIIDLFHSVYRLLDIFSCFLYCRKRAKECTNLIISIHLIIKEEKSV